MNVVINGVGEQVGEGILNASVGGIIKGQAPNKNGNVLIYNKNWQSSLVKDKRAAIYAGIKGDAQDIDNGKKVWNFVGINVNDAAYSLSKSGYGVRSMADIQKLDESKESRALNNSLKNEKLKLTAKELSIIFRDDPEGVKGYLTAKNDEKLINDTFREITGEEPTYYLHMPLNGWEKTEDTKGDIISCVTSDAKELLINKPKGPRDMIDVIDTGFKIGAVCFGAAELSLIMEGVERFGVKNTITMYSNGKLAENVEYNKSISAQNGAVGSASTEGITTKGAPKPGTFADMMEPAEAARYQEYWGWKYAETSPIEIPSNATMKIQSKTGYDQIQFKWSDGNYKYDARWHTRTPGAPAEQGSTWVIERITPGNVNGQRSVSYILTGEDEWTPRKVWQDAITARQNGVATDAQNDILKGGHWPAP